MTNFKNIFTVKSAVACTWSVFM